MSDIFISYARSAVSEAVTIEAELRALGYSVWRDDQLPTHRPYADVLEERVNAAKAVVVIWSADAIRSDWVRAEADAARKAGTLVQLSLDGVAPPMPFGQIHCAEMKGWSGDFRAPAWRKVVASVAELIGADKANGRSAQPSAERSIEDGPLLAVLAFDNISGDEELLYFTDGVSEEILQTVARTTQLKVIGRSSSFQLRGADKAAARVARALRATHVLDGSVRRSGQRVRIAANLIECAGETTLWSDRFDRELSDIFVLQDEIAAAVAAALEVVFARTRTAAPINPSAHDLYLRAQSLITGHIASEPMTDAVIGLLEEATRLAPRFATAWGALATMRAAELRSGEQGEPYTAARDKVVSAVQAALAADPDFGMPHLALASLEPFGHYEARELLIDRALAAAPHDLHVLTTAAFFSAEVGRIQEAVDRAKLAFGLDPMQFQASYAYATFMDAAGRYAETKALWDTFCDRWPDSEMTIDASMAAAMQNADWVRFESIARSPTVAPDPNGRRRAMAWYARNLRTPDAQSIGRFLERSRQEQQKAGSIRLDRLATLYNLGLKDETFELIDRSSFAYMFDPERGWPHGSLHGSYIFNASANRGMIADPRFPRLCAKMGLCDYWLASGRWPDCADQVAYDFRGEARRLTGASGVAT